MEHLGKALKISNLSPPNLATFLRLTDTTQELLADNSLLRRLGSWKMAEKNPDAPWDWKFLPTMNGADFWW